MRTISEAAEDIKSILNNVERTEECTGETLVDINELVDEILTINCFSNNTTEIRNNSIDEFAERLKDSLLHNYRHLLTVDKDGFEWLTTDAVGTHIDEIVEQMKGGE